jgi:phosphatidylglycerophosphate synthase
MLDPFMRRLIDPPLNLAGRGLARGGVSADAVTIGGFVVGLAAVPLLAAEQYGAALVLLLLNRLSDGLDGAIARQVGATDFGGFLDIVCDFIFYAAFVLGFALARPEANALVATFLVLSFVGTGTTFLAYAIIAAKYGATVPPQKGKAFYYLGGLTEGTETIAFFVALCLLPDQFVPLALMFGALCWITTASRVMTARQAFAPQPRAGAG